MNKETLYSHITTILAILVIVGSFVMMVFVCKQIADDRVNKTDTICDELGLDILSVSRQVFGDDYVICYDKETNKTKRIEI